MATRFLDRAVKSGGSTFTIEERWKLFNPFSKYDRNLALRAAYDAGGTHWIDVWLPKRFTSYARAVLGYRVTSKYDTAKRNRNGDATPMVWSGAFQDQALRGARPDAKVTSKNNKIIIRIPGPSYIGYKEVIGRTIRTIPQIESNRVAEVVVRTLTELFNEGVSKLPAGGMVKNAGKKTARRTNDLYNKEQRTIIKGGLRRVGTSASRSVAAI
jgi:hypothetical protein